MGIPTFSASQARTSATLADLITDETGTGAIVLATSPTLVTPALGTPSAVVLTNATGLPIAGITGLGTGVDAFLATPSSANLLAAVTGETGTGAAVFAESPTLVTPALGAATATSVAATGNLSTSGGTIGYAVGAGGTVTQATDKSTGVELNKICGEITMHNASLNADTSVTFTVTNSLATSTDGIILNHRTNGTVGAYLLTASPGSGSFNITVRNITGGALGEAIIIRFNIIKGTNS